MASMSTQMASLSSSSSSFYSTTRWKHDVFLSFYGKDTRNGFTDHLYDALQKEGLDVFKDDKKLKQGTFITPELMKAIEESKYAITILSENYAFSRWCLEELAKIVECMKETELTVLPIFYHVNPSDVRNQKMTFEQAFAKHETDVKVNKERMQLWRDALREVGNISGWHLHNRPESEVIQEIIKKIHNELHYKIISIPKDLVGMNSRMEEMVELLGTRLDDVHFIAIWGIGGIGKTTLAEVVYNKICYQFEASSFIGNVREEVAIHGLVSLQNQILSEVLKEKEVNIRDVRGGRNMIANRLRKRKVLIVLDDVNEDRQLEALAGSHNWFGQGSKIIITSRDKQLLKRNDVDDIYMAKILNKAEALKLFSLKAFKKPSPEVNYVDLSNKLVEYAQGLPLALKVLGSSLFDRTIDAWKDVHDQLKKDPKREILDVLQISFDGLEDRDKKIFLDVACFFKGEEKNRVANILKDYSFHMAIENLKDKSLIYIFGRKLLMHDLLQEMGWEIVRRESREHGRRSRLWLYEDIFYVLRNETGTELVEGMMLNSPPHEEENLNAKTFSMMKKLSLLKIHNVQLPQGLYYLSNELRLLEWHGYPLKSMPISFQPKKLVELIMPHSHINQLPEGFNNSPEIKLINLSDSQYLKETPNFIGLPNLERLVLQGCTSLRELHPSVGALNRLTLLNLKDCRSLNKLPLEINLKSLEIFILSGCSTLKKFPDIGKNMTRLLELYLDGTAIEELPPSIEHFTGLSLLSLKDCKRLSRFPRVDLPSLKTLILSGCKFQPPKSWLSHGLSVIRAPHVSNDFFPTQSRLSHGLPVILAPHVSNDFLPTQSRLPHGLPVIRAPHVSNYFFPTLGPFNQLLPWLSRLNVVSLDLSDCSLLDGALPDDLTCLSSLQLLNLRKNNFTRLPDSISQLSKLVDLNLNDCSKLQSLPNLPQSIGLVTARRCTSLANYSNQQSIRWTSRERGVAIVDCRSDKSETDFGFHVGIPWNPIGFDQFLKTVPKIRCQPLGFRLDSDLTEIPEWFNYRSPAGSPVEIPISSNPCDNNSWSGIAFLAISVPPDISYGKEFLIYIKITCHSDMVGGLESCTRKLPIHSEVCRDSSFAYGRYIPARKLIDDLDEYSFINVSITSNHPHIVFKCGARKVNVEDVTEFAHVIKKSYPHVGSSTEDHPVVSCQSDWKRDLESLLLGLYQGDWAKNHKYDYIIPYISVPAWFLNHRFCSSIRIRLPRKLKSDERWMGIAVCAYYTVDKQLAGSDDQKDLTSFLCFYSSLPSHQIRLTRHKVFQESEDIFVDSTHRILVYYIPQMSVQLRRCSHCCHIGASFEPKNPGVQVKECGIQLVFEQNVEEFVQTLVRCMLRCPDAYHEFFYHNLLSHKNERESCFDNGKNNGCSSSSQRVRQPMPNIAKHCTSPESFSNPQIDVGTSRNFSPSVTGFLIPTRKAQHGSIMSSESSIKACLQKNCEDGEILHGYSAELEIPQWFCNQNNGRAVKLPQPQELCNGPDLMGLALCGLFHFTQHPTAVLKNFDSRTFNLLKFQCFLETSSSPMRSVCNGPLSEDNELISLIQRSFIWVLFIPYTAHSHLWSQSTWFNFLFTSNSPGLCVESCGINLVYRHNMEELTRIMARCSAPFDRLLDNTSDPETVYYMWDNFPEIFIEATSSSEYLHPRLFISQGDTIVTAQYSYHKDDPYPDNQFRYFHPSTPYNFCFPTRRTRRTAKWFIHQSRGHSISIDITSNLYDDSNWMGLALYASFSIDKDDTIFRNMVSISSPDQFLYCQFELSRGSLDQILVCRINCEEIEWLINLFGFSWISYIPGEAFKDVLNQCDHMKASFVSDWPGVIVKKCGLRLLYQHDRLQFEREVQHCNTLISAFQDFLRWFRKQEIVRYGSDITSETPNKLTTCSIHLPKIHLPKPNKMKPGLDGCFEYFGCFPPVEILRWFSSQSNEPSVTIYVPKYFNNDIDCMGLVLCANFSIQEHQTVTLENPNSIISHHLICLLETDVAGSEHLLVHLTNNEEFIWLDTEGQFLWLSCISRGMLPDEFNQSGCIKASIISDWPGVMVQKCGLSFFHVNDDWFREMRYTCEKEYIFQNFFNQMAAGELKMKQDHDDETGPRRTSSSNEDQIHHKITSRPIDKGETSEAKDQHSQSNPLVISNDYLHLGSSTKDNSVVSCQRYSTLKESLESLLLGLYQGDWAKNYKYDYIFPYITVPAWFRNHRFCSSIRIRLPENLKFVERWMGIAVCAYYTVDKQLAGYDDRKDLTSFLCFYNPLPNHQIRLTRHKVFQDSEDIFVDSKHRILVYYIPRTSFRFRECTHIGASFEPKNPGVQVKECGIQLVFEQNVEEFVQTLVRCMLRCPDAYHEFFYHNLLSHKNERESCFDNGKDNGCSSSSQRMRQPMPNIAEHCTSPESFSNPQIDVGTSRNFSPSVTGFLIPTRKAQHGSIMSSESSIKACLQKNCEDGEILHGYSAEREIPQWFCSHTSFGNSVQLWQPQELCNDPDLMGLALCGLFHFTRHPTAVRRNSDSRIFKFFPFKCFLRTSSCPMRLVCNGLLGEDNELISLNQYTFIWILFVPCTAHSHLWSQSTWFKFSFTSSSADLCAKNCAINLVYRHNMEELTRIMARCSAPFDRLLDNTSDPETVYDMWDNFPEIFIEATSSSEYLHPQRLFISQGDTSVTAQYSYHEDDPFPDNQFRYFHPSTPYNFCFPTRRTLKWFNHQSRGYSISIDISSNLYDDSNWMGLAVYASFSIEREYRQMVSTFSPHFLYCQFELSRASLNQIHVCRINYEENQWLHNLYGFSWISYIPGEAFKDVLNQGDHMKASFVSDWPGVIVQKCGLHLLYQHDRLQFEREVQHCNTLISAYQDFERWLRKEGIKNYGLDMISEIMDTRTPNKMKLGLDGCFEYFGCFPLVNVLRSFSSQSNGPSVTIYVPKYFYNDIDWMGLVLCANFSIQEHQTAILENPNSTISHHLICLLETDVAGSEHLLVHLTNNEEFIWLDTEGQFLWLSCISRGLLPDEFNQSGCIKASIISDWPGVMVQKCGLSFFHVNDDLFREMRYHCEKEYIFQNFINQMTAGKLKMKQDHDDETGPRRTSSSNEDQIHHEITRRPIDKGETSEAKDQHSQSNLLDFDHHLVHNFCFGRYECLCWFSNQNDSPSLTINSIRNLCSDNTWLGFALFAFFELNEDQNSILDILDSETSYNLICHLETNIGSVKPRHIHCPTKKDLMLSQTGGFFWLSYIPRGSLPDWLNHCILAKFSFATNCPGLTAQKCGFLPLYKHTGQKCGLLPMYKHTGQICDDGSGQMLFEKEFKGKLTRFVKSLSTNWNIIWKLTIDNTNRRRQKHDNEARPSTSGRSNEDSHPERRTEHVGPMLKDKGKRVLE